MGVLAGGIRRNDRLDPPLREFFAQAPGVVSAVGEDPAGPMPPGEQPARALKVVDVAGGNQQGMRAADLIGQRMDFGRLSAARAADGVVEGPPFAPAAERWALM